jgi:tetratricopeptide (TPR) repeat protein
LKMTTLILALAIAFPALDTVGPSKIATPSPAQLRIEAAHKAIQRQPNRYQGYNDLALALIRRTRETGDSSCLQQAQSAIDTSLKIQPDNFEGGEARVALLLAEQRYRLALEEAKALNHRMPDAVLIWGHMADAQEALGDYKGAEDSAQWMMNLRPGNVGAYLEGAVLRGDWGDTDGALDFFDKALQQTPPFETEQTAWTLTEMARLDRQAGRLKDADELLGQALKAFPGYHLSLDELAEVRIAQHCPAEAVAMVRQSSTGAQRPSETLLLARALDGAGQAAESENAYQEFERQARAQIAQPENANIELVDFYVEHAQRPEEALRIARLEMQNRHDLHTLDAFAWALYANHQYVEANREIEKALAVGTRDPVLLYHAGEIAAASGKSPEAKHYFEQSLATNPASPVSEAARRALTQSGNYTAVR